MAASMALVHALGTGSSFDFAKGPFGSLFYMEGEKTAYT